MKKREDKVTWPFENSGLLTTERMFRILLLKRNAEICTALLGSGRNADREWVLAEYKKFLSDDIIGLSEQEKEFLINEEKENLRSLGFIESILKFTDFDIYVGSMCKILGDTLEIGKGEKIKALIFYKEADEEIENKVRKAAIRFTKREITMVSPEVKTECFCAVRPPAGNWGMAIRRENAIDRNFRN